MIVHDLKQRRTKDYEFNWNAALDVRIFFVLLIILISCLNDKHIFISKPLSIEPR